MNVQKLKPRNNPEAYLKKHSNIDSASSALRTVCIGDSITFGKVSANYVKMLEYRFIERAIPMDFINAGINGDLAYSVVQRLDPIIACQPHYATILIGTNDANASMIPATQIHTFMKDLHLPQPPTKEGYSEMVKTIIHRLQTETHAKIALLSIPPVGENPEEPPFQKSMEYAEVIKEIALSSSVLYLPLQEQMVDFLRISPSKNAQPYEKAIRVAMKAVFLHLLLRRSWNAVGKRSGFQFHSDHFHLNENGAKMIADLIEQFITQNLPAHS
jgi:lysophospholipase L1-like esterase